MQTNKEKQDKRKAEMQAAAERDGFPTASAAITAWKNGKARLTKRAPDYCFYCDEKKSPAKQSICQDCVDLITRNSG